MGGRFGKAAISIVFALHVSPLQEAALVVLCEGEGGKGQGSLLDSDVLCAWVVGGEHICVV
jgi:hypothetical protein